MADIPRLSRIQYIILELLVENREMLTTEIVAKSDGRVKQGTLYVTLNRMAEKGYVESRDESQPPGAFGPARKLYKPTGYGVRVLQAWQEMAARWQGALPWAG